MELDSNNLILLWFHNRLGIFPILNIDHLTFLGHLTNLLIFPPFLLIRLPISDFQETYDNIVSCDYTTDEPEFEDISEEAKDFIVKLLKVKHDDRMSADEALEHPWLKSAMIQKKPPRRVSMLETSPRLNNVMSRLKWQKCTNVLLACSKFKQALSQ